MPVSAERTATPRFPFSPAKVVLPLLLMGGLALRLLFLWVGAGVYYKSNSPFCNGDTDSFTQSFLNLWQHGVYSFNLLNAEAAFGRLPGYPFFWGAHYLVFGAQHVFQAVAFSQCLLDTVAIYLIYATARALTCDIRAAWISAALYACYPFVIVWLTISGSESLATFVTILILWWLATRPVSTRNVFIAGLLVGFGLLVREYLGVLLVPMFIWIYSANDAKERGRFVRLSTIAVMGFLLLYVGWPIRNYVFQHRFMLLKPPTAGYDRYADDVNTARAWVYGWSPDADAYLDAIAGKAPLPAFPQGVFKDSAERERAYQLFAQAQQCGTGFYNWRYLKRYDRPTNCNAELASGFTGLNSSYKQRHLLRYWTEVPLLNLKKAFFKNQLMNSGGSRLVSLLFGYRTLILLLCAWGVFLLRQNRSSWPVMFFFVFMYLFICIGLRQLEMRYLLQADAAILSVAGAPFVWLLNRFKGKTA
ncbi:ArnT family glycosyltransferase [Hymenobacter negativus]|uniref:Glycosyltransferase family 39 protein n=1 Tax=Hymenobacter negativus TaxID=2795026 RepID=A0ABS3QFN8_9BACT|nr:glycosyltransferase family 39 protein [Hymenobacter negativus]MBO2009505.1 glycosyltransferase family 39 protein [Hymenobacter negativus]